VKRTLTWDEFRAEVAQVADVSPGEIDDQTRVLEDLGLDSLALTELVVILVDKYDVWSLSKDLENRRWANVTVRQLYDEYLTGAPTPPAAPSSAAVGG
jgi:acyl carrier protein